MARRTKNETPLTSEEKLVRALVPEFEQPYPIPDNWRWVMMSTICNGFQYGYTDSATFEEIGPHFIRITDLGDGIINDSTSPYCQIDVENYPKYKIHKGDILIARMGSVGENGLATHDIEGVFASYLIRLIPCISPLLIRDYLQSPLYWNQITDKSQGTTRLNVNANVLKKIYFPLPPYNEHKRIVDRIEGLFAKLDESKEKAQAVVDGYEDRKAAILHKVFTGELTKQWRDKNGYHLSQWKKRKLKDCGDWMGGGTPSMAHPEYWENGNILWITSKDMKADVIQDTLMHTNLLGVENSSANYNDKPSILFVMRSGILRRTLPIAIVKVPFTVNQDLKALSPHDINTEYLFWACEGNEQKILKACMKSGTTVESINSSALLEYEIPIAPQEEQAIIVSIIEKYLQKEQQAKDLAEQVIEQIDSMKKSILARAFRGELGTNDPSDESAEELLKRIL